MSSFRKYPVGIQSFEKLRKDGYLYIDKTPLIYKMITEGCPYFLSRPRRFGKSLLISTLQAVFGADVRAEEPTAKGYADKYAPDGRPVTKIGIAFSTNERNISEWKSR